MKTTDATRRAAGVAAAVDVVLFATDAARADDVLPVWRNAR
jgi:hypothetical protein